MLSQRKKISLALGLVIVIALVITEFVFGYLIIDKNTQPIKCMADSIDKIISNDISSLNFMEKYSLVTYQDIFKNREYYSRRPVINPSLVDYTRKNKNAKWSSLNILAPQVIESEVRLKDTKDLVYKVNISVNSFNHRETIHSNKKADKFIIFLGGYAVFGDGLEDWQTLPSYSTLMHPETQGYNFGCSSDCSLSTIWKLLKTTVISNEVKEEKGYAILQFIDDDIKRVIGTNIVLNSNMVRKQPYYILDENNRLQMGDSLEEELPFRMFLSRLLSYSNIYSWSCLDFPTISDRHLEIVAKIIKQIELEIKSKMDIEDFYVLFYPIRSIFYADKIIPFLEKENISTIDMSKWNIYAMTGGKSFIPYDGGPSKEANMVLGKAVYSIIKEKTNGLPSQEK